MPRLLALMLMTGLAAACGSSPARPQMGDATDDAWTATDGTTTDGTTQTKCSATSDCPGDLVCNPITGKCVECTVNEHCQPDQECVSNQCLTIGECTPGEATCNDQHQAVVCNQVGTGYLPPEDCNDKVECTADTCKPGPGCLHTPDHSLCDDANPCTDDNCATDEGCQHKANGNCTSSGTADTDPKSIVFAPAVPGEQMTQKNIILTNVGLGNLEVYSASIQQEAKVFFLFSLPANIEEVKTFDPPYVLETDEGISFTLAFVPEELGSYSGSLRIVTSDSSRTDGTVVVPLTGNAVADNCVQATPKKLDFGAKEIGITHTLDLMLQNCGDGLVPIYAAALAPSSAPEFTIVASLTPPFDLDIGHSTSVIIGFSPTEPNHDYQGTLVVQTAAPKMPLIEVPLTGNGIAQNATCPISVVDYTGPDIVPPFKPVKLSGVPSYGLGAGVTGYQWSAEQPAGGNESFSPNSQAQLVQFTPVVTGQYLFKLKVFDANGQPSCNTASTSVLALPEHDVFIELLWYTPGDPDPTDSGPGKGTDLDLHLLSPKALGPDVDLDGEPDGWFDPVYDCYPANKTPNWGKSDPAAGDDPILLRADSDGIGPESIAFNKPADAIYKVGVHYVNDSGFGDSFASIRIYIHQGLAWQSPYFKLAKGDLWDAARISVDGIDVQADAFTSLDGSPVVIPNYPVPK